MTKLNEYGFICDKFVIKDDKIFFPWSDGNGLCEMEADSLTVENIYKLPNISIRQRRSYISIHLWESKLVLLPGDAADILIFDTISHEFETVTLDYANVSSESQVPFKFWDTVLIANDLYLFGHGCAAIIKINLVTKKVVYFQKWADVLLRDKPFLTQLPYLSGGCIVDEYIYIASGCTNSVVKINTQDDSVSVVDIPSNVSGFNGIVFQNGIFYLTSREQAVLTIWNDKEGWAKDFIIEPLAKSIGFYAPISWENTIFLFPIAADCVYEVDAITMDIKKNKELSELLHGDRAEFSLSGDVVDAPSVFGDTLYFICGADYRWCKYSLTQKKVQDMRVATASLLLNEYLFQWKYDYMLGVIASGKPLGEDDSDGLKYFINFCEELKYCSNIHKGN